MKTIDLTFQELALAGVVGVFRHISALQRGRPSAHRYTENDSWTTHIEGAAAEMAVAKHLHRFWSPLANGSLDAIPGDVDNGVQVRSTPRADGSLIVHPPDPDDHVYYLVISHTPPTYRIVGWLGGRDAKRDECWRADPGVRSPAFFVPQRFLHEVAT